MRAEEIKKEHEETADAQAAGAENQASEQETGGEPAGESAPETEEKPDECRDGSASETEAGIGSEETDAGKESSGEKKGFFKKKKDPRDEKIEELTDRVKRQMAEFDNFRKRTDKEKSAMYEMGARDIIERILPIVDNFERGLATVPEDAKETPFAQGME